MKKYLLFALAGLFAVGTVTAAVTNTEKKKKKKHACCSKMEKKDCKKEMKNCVKM